ncbi:MAG: nif-specific transcriptional activator NifA [Hyphomicrobiaceae bacterium]|nr:nif-specific transcriptional activator NifA [Hyphomicrobiaceae bacterium]
MGQEHQLSDRPVRAGERPRYLVDIALSGVYEIAKILARPAPLEVTLSNVLNVLSSYLDLQHATIMLLDDDSVPEVLVGAFGSQQVEAGAGGELQRHALDQIVATAMPLVVENVVEHHLFAGTALAAAAAADDSTTTAFVGVPIKLEARVVGTLYIDRKVPKPRALSFDHDVRFLSMIANLIGQTVQLHRVIARDRERLMEESRRLERELDIAKPARERVHVAGIIGESQSIKSVLDKIRIVAKSNATVLLRGESGTGKELFARAIHELSPRAGGAFVKVNCAALPETVLESELFGHEKGAFTGAVNARKGRFELADGGTIFLDEIGEISPMFQAKLLRVLQEGEVDRVGGSKTIKVDVRVVAATNRNLEEAVARKEFRADLYYRISVVPLMLPPLRDRKGDIPVLAHAFLTRFNKQNGRDLRLAQSAIDVLKACGFPGNVRELENCICRTATLAVNETIQASDFGCKQGECLSASLWRSRNASVGAAGPSGLVNFPDDLDTGDVDLDEAPGADEAGRGGEDGTGGLRVTRERLLDAMERTGWVQAKAARMLGLTPRQIGYALKKHGIELKKL